jgi:hypothetical protein
MSSRIEDFGRAGAAARGVDQRHQHRARLRDIERDAFGFATAAASTAPEHDLLQFGMRSDLERAQVGHRRMAPSATLPWQLLPTCRA